MSLTTDEMDDAVFAVFCDGTAEEWGRGTTGEEAARLMASEATISDAEDDDHEELRAAHAHKWAEEGSAQYRRGQAVLQAWRVERVDLSTVGSRMADGSLHPNITSGAHFVVRQEGFVGGSPRYVAYVFTKGEEEE